MTQAGSRGSAARRVQVCAEPRRESGHGLGVVECEYRPSRRSRLTGGQPVARVVEHMDLKLRWNIPSARNCEYRARV